MKVGVFTALLSTLSFEKVLKKLSRLNVRTVELGTGNYPGDPHCKLVMLDIRPNWRSSRRSSMVKVLHQRAELPWQSTASGSGARAHHREVSSKTILLAEKLGSRWWSISAAAPAISQRQVAQLGDLSLAAASTSTCSTGSGRKWSSLIGPNRLSSPPITA